MQQFSSCSVIFRCVDYYNFFSLITSELIYLQALTSFYVSEQDYVVHSKIFDRFAQHLKVFLMFLFTWFFILLCFQLQIRLYQYLASDFLSNSSFVAVVRRCATIVELLHAIKFYYWVVPPRAPSTYTVKEVENRPSRLVSLR